jgi:hypothetical protein
MKALIFPPNLKLTRSGAHVSECGNIFNPQNDFDTVLATQCTDVCPGNSRELCGGGSAIMTVFQKDDAACLDFRGKYSLTSGSWRLVNLFKYVYSLVHSLYTNWMDNSDTVGARALPHNAVDLHPPLPRGNLTIAACMNACNSSGNHIFSHC